MTGSTGYVGSRMQAAMQARANWCIAAIGRDDFAMGASAVASKLDGADVVMNLAGAPILARWTDEYKRTLRASRIDTTRKLVDAISAASSRPKLLISTSAVGIYEEGGTHTESRHTFSNGFLGSLAMDWEAEALRARDLGVRTVIFRFGVVIGAGGGALAQMMPPFRLGLGGTIGDGKQYMSWVHMDDLIEAHMAAIDDESYEGIYNLTSPNPVTNAELTAALGKALNRPALMRVPGFVLRLQYGEGASVLMDGVRALPERLLEKGFKFKHPSIEAALLESTGGG